jgi:replicative DNA helicase
MISPTEDPRLDIVFSGAQLAEASGAYIQRLEKAKEQTGFTGIPMCIPSLDKQLDPGFGGTIRVVQGRPGHGKTSLLWYHATVWSKVIKASGRRSCVVYATAETMAEHLNLMHAGQHLNISMRDIIQLNISDEQKQAIETWNMTERPGIPLFVLGMSFNRKIKQLDIHPDRIGEAVEAIQEHYGLEPELVCVDYLQILKPNDTTKIRNSDTKTITIGENMSSLKRWAQRTGVFWEVGVQAGRQVDENDPPFPDQGDAQWASAIEQETDSGISITRPWKHLIRGGHNKLRAMLDSHGISTDLADEQAKAKLKQVAVITTWKQKFYDVGNTIVKFDPRYNQIDEWEAAYAMPD